MYFKIIRLLTLLVSLTILSAKCEKYDPQRHTLHLQNNASHTIVYYGNLGPAQNSIYPDTTLPGDFSFEGYQIAAGEQKTIHEIKVSWLEFLNSLPSDTLSIYLFHPDTLRKYSWDEVRTDYKVLKRYDLSLEELERISHIIVYP